MFTERNWIFQLRFWEKSVLNFRIVLIERSEPLKVEIVKYFLERSKFWINWRRLFDLENWVRNGTSYRCVLYTTDCGLLRNDGTTLGFCKLYIRSQVKRAMIFRHEDEDCNFVFVYYIFYIISDWKGHWIQHKFLIVSKIASIEEYYLYLLIIIRDWSLLVNLLFQKKNWKVKFFSFQIRFFFLTLRIKIFFTWNRIYLNSKKKIFVSETFELFICFNRNFILTQIKFYLGLITFICVNWNLFEAIMKFFWIE